MLLMADPYEFFKTKALMRNSRTGLAFGQVSNLLRAGQLLKAPEARGNTTKKMSENDERSRNVI
jgi:hypothetical protein